MCVLLKAVIQNGFFVSERRKVFRNIAAVGGSSQCKDTEHERSIVLVAKNWYFQIELDCGTTFAKIHFDPWVVRCRAVCPPHRPSDLRDLPARM